MDEETLSRPAFRAQKLARDVVTARSILREAESAQAAAPKSKRRLHKPLVSAAAKVVKELEDQITDLARQADPGTATPELRQHRDVDARPAKGGGSGGQRVLARLDALHRSGRIDSAEVRAGEAYRNAYEFGELGGRLGGGLEGAPTGDGCGITARLDAVKRLRAAREALGSNDWRRAMDALAEDVSWNEMGRRLLMEPDQARDIAVSALGVLVAHYGLRAEGTGARMRSARFVSEGEAA